MSVHQTALQKFFFVTSRWFLSRAIHRFLERALKLHSFSPIQPYNFTLTRRERKLPSNTGKRQATTLIEGQATYVSGCATYNIDNRFCEIPVKIAILF